MYEFKMPALGAEMTHGTLLEWKIKVGELVKKHDILAVIDTDKAAIEIESFGEGIVEKLITTIGEKVPVGTVMALIRGEAEKVEQPLSQLGAVKISPRARKMANELGVDFSKIKGSGPDGSIIEEDIKKFATIIPPKEGSHAVSMKKVIAAAMTRSKREIPHYYLSNEIDLSCTLNWLEEYNKNHSITERILYVVPLIKAVINAIKKYPEFNGYFVDNEFKPSASIHVGMAISLREGGLIVPAILNAEQLTLVEIMNHLTDLVERARSGKLRGSELSEGTMTITNLGEFGVTSVFGIIYPPQVALVGFGKVTARNTIITSLSADHRVTNGLVGSRFLNSIDEFLQEPDKL